MSEITSPKFCWVCKDPIVRGVNYPQVLGAGSPDAVFYSCKEYECGIERRCTPCGGGSRWFKKDLTTKEVVYDKRFNP